MLSNLNQPLTTLPGIGQKRENLLESVGIKTVADLLLYLPYRYLDRSMEVGILQLPLGREVTAVGEIVAIETLPGKRRRLVVTVEDETGRISCTWFGSHPYLRGAYEVGDLVALGGKLSHFGGQLQMTHPDVEVLSTEGDKGHRLHTGRIIPLYHTTAKMKAERMSARALRRILFAALDQVGALIADPLPEAIRRRAGVVGLRPAIEKIHFPDSYSDVDAARKRLAFDEIFFIQMYLGQMRKEREKTPGRVLCPRGGLATKLVADLPFELTGAQKRCVDEIGADVIRSVAMHRLLQGDVGSGKTVVALLAMLAAVDTGCQASLMAPTQILAEQHARTIVDLVKPLDLGVRLLTGRTTAAVRKEILTELASGAVSILIGTHALVQDDLIFKDLGLVVVDEQHRFGVAQRALLRDKGTDAHLLVMTATPIPRSLALTLYGDLDVTVLDELPPGRKPVNTGWRPSADRGKALGFICREVEQGRQAYIVYPLVAESGKSDLKAATHGFEELSTGQFSHLRLGLLHGRMKGDEKEATMAAFRRGDVQVLVATTVIEVGVDVPNATVIMVEHAERFGLSQLHQLRGRVGRGLDASYCILIADPKEDLSDEAKERLDAMAQHTDGFEISEVDLRIRGPGQIFGTRQAGFPEFRFADLSRDGDVVVLARGEAQRILNEDPDLTSNVGLRDELGGMAWDDLQIVEAG